MGQENTPVRKRRPTRMLLVALLASVTALAAAITPVAFALNNFYWGTLGGNRYVNAGYYEKISYIKDQADHNDYCVYRATAGYAGAPSASGVEYCSGTGDGGYVYQSFHCYGGYPASHNRHSFSIYVSYTTDDYCVGA